MNEFAEGLDRLLADLCTPAVVREIDGGGPATELWDTLTRSGYLDAMVAEDGGGAGLSLADAFALFVLDGKYAVPVPLARTMATRGLGPDKTAEELPTELGAVVASAQIVGALERVLDMTLAYARQRTQFGRPISRFQVIQHQLAVMAEQVSAARVAAQIGCASSGRLPDRQRAAVAKSVASEAAAKVAAAAHAVHGAIGITAEYDLQLFTRRLHRWRADFGSETRWNHVLGQAVLQATEPMTLDYMRAALLPS